MIQEVKNLEKTKEYIRHYVINVLKDDLLGEELSELGDLIEQEDTFIYEYYQKDVLEGVFIGSFNHKTIFVDFYCNQTNGIIELIDFLKAKYAGYILNVNFNKKEHILHQVLKNCSASIETVSYLLNYSSVIPSRKMDNDILIVKYNPKYDKMIKKMNPISKLDFEMVYVALKKKKPIGYIEISMYDEKTIYIENLDVLPKYKNIKADISLVDNILKNYLGYKINVIVSSYDDNISLYKDMGFEIEDGRTFFEASLLLTNEH
ncbi:MAG: GNAT family N-acetyltransferase [Anaeroplasmataceae bacterium]|nr:GNAT family N-acetyltransferase [Anaeroplasmataceae bacterium]